MRPCPPAKGVGENYFREFAAIGFFILHDHAAYIVPSSASFIAKFSNQRKASPNQIRKTKIAKRKIGNIPVRRKKAFDTTAKQILVTVGALASIFQEMDLELVLTWME